MARPSEAIWLLARRPPYWVAEKGKPAGELALWWGVIRQACRDLRKGHHQQALDALEFLRDTGQWLAVTFYEIDPVDYQQGIAMLVMMRNRERGEHLCVPAN